MTTLELVLNMLVETTTKELLKKEDPKTLSESKEIAQQGGGIAGNAREDIEKRLGTSVVSKEKADDIHFSKKKELS